MDLPRRPRHPSETRTLAPSAVYLNATRHGCLHHPPHSTGVTAQESRHTSGGTAVMARQEWRGREGAPATVARGSITQRHSETVSQADAERAQRSDTVHCDTVTGDRLAYPVTGSRQRQLGDAEVLRVTMPPWLLSAPGGFTCFFTCTCIEHQGCTTPTPVEEKHICH